MTVHAHSGSRATSTLGRLPFWSWTVIWLALCVGGAALWHWQAHGVVNAWQLCLSLFLAINIATCLHEIALGLRISTIEAWHHDPERRAERPGGSMWLQRVSPVQLLSVTFWARMWYEYAYYDPSYADRRSFGFAVDVGNGWSTLVPSVLFLVGMTWPFGSARLLGVIGLLLFYQKFYLTCLYLFTFVFNKRYELNPPGRVAAVVGGSNGVWLVFPAVGLYVSARLLMDGSFDVLWR